MGASTEHFELLDFRAHVLYFDRNADSDPAFHSSSDSFSTFHADPDPSIILAFLPVSYRSMEQITIKTPNPNGRLFLKIDL